MPQSNHFVPIGFSTSGEGAPERAGEGGSVKVVLLEDHLSIRQMLGWVLRNSGYEVVGEANGGIEGLRLCRMLRPQVVILDLALPELGGVHVLRLLGEQMPEVRTLVYSGSMDEGMLREALTEQPDGFVRKEESLEELREALRAVAAGRRHVSPLSSRLSPGRNQRDLARLSPQERAVLQMIAEGRQNKEIAEVLGAALKTVDNHRQHLMEKLDLHDVASLTRFAVKHHMVTG